MALQKSLVPAVEGGYVDKFLAQFHWGIPLENLRQFQWNAERLWWNGFSPLLQRGVFVATLALALLGALVVVGTFAAGESLTVDPRVAGTLAAGVALWRRAPFVVVVAIACAATALVRVVA